MIAIKNLQSLHSLLIQEEMLRAIAGLYLGMTKSDAVRTMLDNIIKTSEKNTAEFLNYVKEHAK